MEELEALKERAGQGCPHALKQLQALEDYATRLAQEDGQEEVQEVKKEVKSQIKKDTKDEDEDCGCGAADRKNSENEKNEEKNQDLPKPDPSFPDKRYNEEVSIPKGTFKLLLVKTYY